MKASLVCVHTLFAFNLLYISELWVKASPRGRLHPSIGAARTGWERVKARLKAKRGEVFIRNCLCVSELRGVGEAVKGKIEKRRTGVRYAHARGGTLHPHGGGDPATERKKRGRTTKKLGGGDGKRATFRSPRRGGNKGGGARRITTRRCKKKVGGRRRNREGFRNFAPQTGHAPEWRRLSPPPPRPAAPMRRENTPSPVTLKRP